MKNYFVNLFVCISQFLNCLLFAGDPNETISGRCYREKRKCSQAVLDAVFKLIIRQTDHCYNSHLADVAFAKMILKNAERDGTRIQ